MIVIDPRLPDTGAAGKLLMLSMFYCLMLVALEVPDIANQYLGHPVPRLNVFLTPLVVLLLLVTLGLDEQTAKLRIPWDRTDGLFVAFVGVGILVEIGHLMLFDRAIDLALIGAYIFVYLCYYTLRSFNGLDNLREHVVFGASQIVCLLSTLQLLGYYGALDTGFPDFQPFSERPDVFNVNTSSYLGVLAICFWLFFIPASVGRARRLLYSVALVPSILMILINQSRGAIVIILALIVIKLLFSGTVTKRAALGLVLAAMFAAALVHGLVKDVERTLSMGRGFTHEMERISRGLDEYSGNPTTVQVRLGLFREAAVALYQNPLIGISTSGARAVRVGEFGLHTHYLTLMLSFGLTGTVLYVLWIASFRREGGYENMGQLLALLATFVGTMTFTNNLFIWYVFLAYLARYPPAKEPGLISARGTTSVTC